MAFLLLLYQIATLAPASASACATASPIPAPAPETMAVRPLREKSGRTWSEMGATVLLWVKLPPVIEPSILADRFFGGYIGENPKLMGWRLYMELHISGGGGYVYIFPIQ